MTDLAVIGGGPVGLVAALAAARQGLGVTVLDKRWPPIDKACGEGLMPEGVFVLESLGVGEFPCMPFEGIRYVDGSRVAEGRFPAGKRGLGARRTSLHAALVERAERAGIDLRWGVEARGLEGRSVVTSDGELAATWIAAADGLHSSTRRWLGAKVRRGRTRRFGVRRHYAVEPWSDCVEVYWSTGAEAYVTPVGPREVGVAMLLSDAQARFDRLLSRFPTLETRLAGAEVTSRDRGAGPLWQRPGRLVWDHLALVGDAAGYADAITGEGLALGFRQAQLLAESLAAGSLGRYERACRRLVTWPFLLIRLLLFIERRPGLRRRAIGALAEEPGLFSAFLASHVAARRPSVGAAVRLVRAMAGA